MFAVLEVVCDQARLMFYLISMQFNQVIYST